MDCGALHRSGVLSRARLKSRVDWRRRQRLWKCVFSACVADDFRRERENSISKKHISIIISIERDSCPSKEVYFVSDPPQVRNNYMAIVNIHARSFINEWERKYSKQADS